MTEDRIIINQWISVNDRLPKFDDHVIVATNKGITSGRLIRLDSHGQHWRFHEDNQIYWSTATVQYWMDLPNESPV